MLNYKAAVTTDPTLLNTETYMTVFDRLYY